ncbi:hypothetical protein HK405_000356, partial [Cladochytrium tenue]
MAEVADCFTYADIEANEHVAVLVVLLNNFVPNFTVSNDGSALQVSMTGSIRSHAYWLPGAEHDDRLQAGIVSHYPASVQRQKLVYQYAVKLPRVCVSGSQFITQKDVMHSVETREGVMKIR